MVELFDSGGGRGFILRTSDFSQDLIVHFTVPER